MNRRILIGNSVLISGTATGARYLADTDEVIKTFIGRANFFQGFTVGSMAMAGQYR